MDGARKGMNTLRRLNIALHQRQQMPLEVADRNVDQALDEIERDEDAN